MFMRILLASADPSNSTRKGEPSVVVVSLDDFQALKEAADLLRTPTKARRCYHD
jgi:PHD/YefM family antitoxin component YafN of YafNO toxin-antitoxin module